MITVTPRAAQEIQTIKKEEGKDLCGLRMMVVGGGCSGFQYQMGFDDAPQHDDQVVESNGVKLFVDPRSAAYLQGVEIDFEEGFNGGFKISNPNAKGSCGCGSSFNA